MSMSSSKTYENLHFSVDLVQGLNKQRLDDRYCDITLIVADNKFPAHRSVLSASSEYFDTMFSSKQMKEQFAKVVSIKEITALAMTKVLTFVYTGSVTLTKKNVNEILQAASLMRIEALLGIAVKFLLEDLKPTNCLYYRNLGQLYSLEALVEQAVACMIQNFEEVSQNEDFCHLEISELESLVSSNDIKVDYEYTIFEAIVKWVKHDEENHKKYFLKLFKHVRMQHISTGYLSYKLRKEAMVRTSLECRDLVEDALLYHVNPARYQPQPHRKEDYLKTNTILCFNEENSSIDFYDIQTESIVNEAISEDLYPLTGCAVGSNGEKAVFCGGELIGQASNKVVFFDGNIFQTLPPMNKFRTSPAVVYAGDLLLVMGGETNCIQRNYRGRNIPDIRDQNVLQNDLELYNFQNKRWIVDARLKTPRCCASAVFLQDEVYLLGGRSSGQNQRVYNLVEIYNTNTKQWTARQSMNEARKSFGSAFINDKILAIGGFDERERPLNSSEFLDIATDVWTSLPPPFPWFDSILTCFVGNKIYAAIKNSKGIYKASAFSNEWVEVYSNPSNVCNMVAVCRK
ncbi:kelch-like protein 28 isoform X1 [Clavelina lepadiformis]|uniref:kelch-like protein 28 isoform X1 n=1 Tax=Clavelina lepadiformis TaxID=159417 RepID=UPI0040418D2C